MRKSQQKKTSNHQIQQQLDARGNNTKTYKRTVASSAAHVSFVSPQYKTSEN